MDIPKLGHLETFLWRKTLRIYSLFLVVMRIDISSTSLKRLNNLKILNRFRSRIQLTCLFKLLYCTQLLKVNEESDVIILHCLSATTKQILLKTQIWINWSASWWINQSVESIRFQTSQELDNICSFNLQILGQQSKECIETKCQSSFHTCWAIAWVWWRMKFSTLTMLSTQINIAI